MSKTKLLISALTKYIAGLLMVALMLFLPAGTWNYFNGWLFIGLLFVPMFLLGIVLFAKSPELLEKRPCVAKWDATLTVRADNFEEDIWRSRCACLFNLT